MADADRIADATAAAVAYVEARRSDLDFTGQAAPDDVWLGAVIYAGILYSQRASPSGFAAFGDGAGIDVAGDPAYPRAMRLIGWRRPVAL